jgi:DhnA family fructose-bisphosphate aldolase class Ia
VTSTPDPRGPVPQASRRGALPVGVRQTAPPASGKGPLKGPALILAADHRARGVITIEPYSSYLGALRAALAHCDGILASTQPLTHLERTTAARHRTYLSLNRTGLAGSVFELDDRPVATVARAVADGCTGIKHMTRIDLSDPLTAGALELLGQVLEEARIAGLEALIEAVTWRDGKMARDTDSIVYAAVVAHDMGAPVLKVPIPDAPPGPPRVEAVARVVSSVGVPVLFLGGPRQYAPDGSDTGKVRGVTMLEAADVMVGGAAGLAIGRALINDPDPGGIAREVSALVHSYGN